ncbi:molybdopterin cofactor-binding domain-containing protein [Roseateles noduli]|uniref:xanthine dehydrogenase family protein molybdopterin-binding subunit n=1 Tax=Roseateles noduli TaxID=2052484 RepID=UPI003D6459D1
MKNIITSKSAAPIGISRRDALRTTGLAIAFVWTGGASKAALAGINPRHQPEDAAAAALDGAPAFAPNAFIRIDTDGTVRLVMPTVEMGQAIYTGSAMLLAEELGVDMDQIKVEHAPPNEKLYAQPILFGQITGGSTSTRATFRVLREAGAVARTLLVGAAAAAWKVDPGTCTVKRGQVLHPATGRSVGFGSIAAAAAKLPMPESVKLKDPKDFQLIGRPLRRVDSVGKVNGSTPFAIDTCLPGMKVATVMASPTLGGTLVSVNDSVARSIPGYVDFVKIGNAVATIGEHYWAAKRALDVLKIVWNRGSNATLTTKKLREAIAKTSETGKSIVAREVGSKPTGTTVEALYQLPMLAHAPMEPMNTTVHVTPQKCEIWVGTQLPTRSVSLAAKICGLPEEKVVLHNQYLGGSFGRRLETDFVEQAVAFAKQVPYPLKVVWSREEDIRQDIVRPMYHDKVSAVVDADGKLVWFGDRICGGSVLDRWLPVALRKDGLDADATECADTLPYDVENLKVEWVRYVVPAGMRVGWWRGVGPNHNLYVVESFIDELAHRAKKDPVEYRRAMLRKNPRMLAVLDLAVTKSGWGKATLPARVGRGIAIGDAFGTKVCAVVEVEVSPQGEVKLRKATVAIDCGLIVNIGSVEAQVQGGLLFGLSAALFNNATLENGAIQQSNFHDYRTLRINETPIVSVHTVKSEESPGGLGEVGTAIAAPALNNAIFAATGVRLRELPVDRALLAQGKEVFKSAVGLRNDADANEGAQA